MGYSEIQFLSQLALSLDYIPNINIKIIWFDLI